MYLRRKLSSSLELYKNLRQNIKFIKRVDHKHTSYVGVGGNIGDVKRRVLKLYSYFKKDKRVGIKKISSILKNPPFGFLEQDDFYNSVVVLTTDMNAKEFLAYLMRVEKRFLRKRSFKDAPRTLDLDMIFFDNLKLNSKKLILPHPFYKQRDSVMIPLKELDRL